MVLTVTLNPAVDKTYTIDRLVKGQVNRIVDSREFAGGKGINVTRVLRQYKQEVIATGLIGGYAGDFISDSLERMGIKCAFVPIAKETRTNVNIISDDGYITEILEPGPLLSEQEEINFTDQFSALVNESEIVILSGSLAQNLKNDYYAKLIRIAKKAGKKVFLDSSGEALREGVKAVPYLIKPNRREFEYICGRKLRTDEDILEEGRILIQKGIKNVIVSLGERGLIFMDEKHAVRATAPNIKAVNTVGSGDCIVAVMAMGLLNNQALEDTIKQAVSVAAANATTLESGQIPLSMAREFINDVEIFSIS